MKLFVVTTFLLTAVFLAGSACKPAVSGPAVNSVSAATTAPQTSSTPTSTPAKSVCSLGMASAPAINGLKIGMTKDEMLAIFPGAKDDAELAPMLSRPPSKFGTSDLMIRPDKYGSKDRFAGINQISFTWLDGRMFTMNVGYAGPAYSHVDEFVTKFVEGKGLPPADQWEAYSGLDTQQKALKCGGFEVEVFAGGEGGNLNHVLVKDLEAEKELRERRAKARAARATPTP